MSHEDPIRALARVGAGYQIGYQEAAQVLHVHAPDGRLSLAITLGADGLKLELRGASLDIVAEREVRIACERFEVTSTAAIDLRSAGVINLTAERDVAVASGEDVRLDGSRLLLNSPGMRRAP